MKRAMALFSRRNLTFTRLRVASNGTSSQTRPVGDRQRIGRLARAAGGLTAVSLAVLIVPPWLAVMIPPSALRLAVIGFLVGLEVAYAIVLMGAVIGGVAFGARCYRVRRDRIRRPVAACGLLLCIGCLMALVLAEGLTAAWRASSRRASSLAKGLPALPERFAEPVGKNEVTLAVLGESSAFGMPFDSWLSVGKIVAWQLGEAIPGKRFRVEMVAKPGDTLERQYDRLAGIRRRPDALIVYCGHNEFAVVPWSRRVEHYRDERPPLLWGLDELAGRVSPLCSLIRETADRFRVAMVPPHDAHPPLVDAPAYTPAEYAARLDEFRRRLEAIAEYGERIGAITVLVVPPGNDTGFDPNRSFLPAGTPRAEREAFARDFLATRRIEDSEPARAVELYRTLLDRQPGFAETHYRLALLLDRAGQWDEAYRHFVAARDLDGLPMRCLSALQQMYRDVAAGHPSSLLVDGQALFHEVGYHGLLDDHLFHDGMHPSLLGHITLAQGILEALHQRRAFGWPGDGPAPAIDPAECAAHFGLKPKDWKPLSERGYMFYYGTTGLRYDPSHRIAKQSAFKTAAQRIAAGDPPEAVGLANIGIPPGQPRRRDSHVRAHVHAQARPRSGLATWKTTPKEGAWSRAR